jgi:hypothetical protein
MLWGAVLAAASAVVAKDHLRQLAAVSPGGHLRFDPAKLDPASLADVDPSSLTEAEREALALRAMAALIARSRAGSFTEPDEDTWSVAVTGEAESQLVSDTSRKMKEFDIYLDAEPEARWAEVGKWAKSRKRKGETMESELWETTGEEAPQWVVEFVSRRLACSSEECETLRRERAGFAAAANETEAAAESVAVFYELMTACTAVLAQREDGSVTLARNMDLYPDDLLRKYTFRARWFRNRTDAKPFASSTQYLGFNGVTTAQAKGFSVVVNQRMTASWFVTNWMSAVLGGVPVAVAVRQALETCDSFACAVTKLQAARIIAPAYLIVAGTKPGEGVVLQRDRSGGSCMALAGFKAPEGSGLDCATAPDGWLLVQANNDFQAEEQVEQTYARRNMAREAMLAAADLCARRPAAGLAGANCRAEQGALLQALEWEFVSRVITVHRDFLDASKSAHAVALVDTEARTATAFDVDFLERLDPAEGTSATPEFVEHRCPRWEERGQCARTWEKNAAALAKDYVAYRAMPRDAAIPHSAMLRDPDAALLEPGGSAVGIASNSTSPMPLDWGIGKLLECPCKERVWTSSRGHAVRRARESGAKFPALQGPNDRPRKGRSLALDLDFRPENKSTAAELLAFNFRVLALTPDPTTLQAGNALFSEAVGRKDLLLVPNIELLTDPADDEPAMGPCEKLFREHGVPATVNVGSEGLDTECFDALKNRFDQELKPKYMLADVEELVKKRKWEKFRQMMVDLGYTGAKLFNWRITKRNFAREYPESPSPEGEEALEKLSDEQSGKAWRGLESLANLNTAAKGVKVIFRWWDSNHHRR